jgi:cation transport regulator ChaC
VTQADADRGTSRHFVFGYGSLLERWDDGRGAGDGGRESAGSGSGLARAIVTELKCFRRTWNVAMDNAQTIPGYKLYLDAATGERRDWFVTFLNVVPDERSTVNGVLFEVSREALEALDHRERNYTRIEVSGAIEEPVDGHVWVYAGTAAAVERFEFGIRTGRAVVCRDYYEGVVADFAAIGEEHRRRFVALTDRPPCPVADLRRVDLPKVIGRAGEIAPVVPGT